MNSIETRRRRFSLSILATAVFAVIAGLVISGCAGTPVANTTEHNQAAAGINLMLTNQPVPIFGTSALRQNLIEVEAIQALGSPTTSFFFPMGTTVVNGKYSVPPFKTCPSQGEPIHATDQLSNPQQVVPGFNSSSDVVGQMDPNGIYSGASSGTYVLCDTASGGTKMAYWEGPVYAESGAAVWNAATGQLDDVGPSQLPVCSKLSAQAGDGTKLVPGTPYYHCVKARA